MKKLLFTIITILFSFVQLLAQQDLQLDTIIFQTKTDSSIHSYYSMIPWSQAKKDTIRFSGVISNNSSVNNTNIVLSNSISTPINFDTVYSSPLNLTPNQTDTTVINQPFTFNDSIGTYSWFFSATSDSTDTILINNSKDTFTIEVTDTTFARDRNASGNYTFSSDGFEVAVMFEVIDTVKATSVTVDFGSNTAPGDVFSVYLYNDSFQVLASNEFNFIDTLNLTPTFSIPDTILAPGKYYVSLKAYIEDIYIKKSDFIADSGLVFIDTNNSGNWVPASFVPPIRLNITNEWWCNIKVDKRITHNCDTFFVIPYNGVPPYTFLWDDGSTKNYFLHPWVWDDREVLITDSLGCTTTFIAACAISVNEQIISQFSVFPNPVRSTINIEFSETINYREHTFEIYNVLGKRVLSRTLTTKLSSINVSQLKPGVYICKFGESMVRVVIE